MGEAKKRTKKESPAPKKPAKGGSASGGKAAAKPAAAKAAPRKKKGAAPVKPVEAVVSQAVPIVETKAPSPPAPAPVQAPVVHHRPKKPKLTGPKYFGTGRRKEAVAKVWLVSGSGKVTVNGKPLGQYFCGRRVLEHYATRPLQVTQLADKYDVVASTLGGGIPGQSGAVGLGIARALIQMNPELKGLLKREGLLTRDPRTKERKKYGRKRARRGFQYSKR